MGFILYSLFWVLQDFDHQPYQCPKPPNLRVEGFCFLPGCRAMLTMRGTCGAESKLLRFGLRGFCEAEESRFWGGGARGGKPKP